MSFSFGAPASAPASTGLGGGFSFGANKPATPGFGLSATTQPSLFGGTATSAAPAFGASSAFGASTTAFGANTSTGFGNTSFGASAAPAFGATSTAPAFGAAAAPAFGATSAAPAFGSTATSAFGATTTPAFGGTNTLSFGATSQPTFGATAVPAFGQTTAPSFGAGLGTGLNFGTNTTTTASTGLNFGAPTNTNTGLGGLGGFGFGAASTQGSFGFGAGTATTTNSLFGSSLGATSAAGTLSTVTPSLGLGGLSQSGIGTTNTTTGDKSEPPKQNKLPNEILANVESFKEFVKKQKSISSDIMRISIKPLHRVSSEAESTLRQAMALSSDVSRARAASGRQRAAAAAALAHAEICARDARAGIELESMAPPQYVNELVSELEQQVLALKRQMEVADKQMQSSPKLLTEQELTLGIRRLHESLVALAGRLQTVHTQVEAQKEQYINLRKHVLNDPTDVFSPVNTSAGLDQILRDAESTRKKSKNGHDSSLGRAVVSDPRVALGNISQLAGPTPFSYVSNSFSPYAAVDNSGTNNWQPTPAPVATTAAAPTFAAPETNSFQLQKPPGKRGKQ